MLEDDFLVKVYAYDKPLIGASNTTRLIVRTRFE